MVSRAKHGEYVVSAYYQGGGFDLGGGETDAECAMLVDTVLLILDGDLRVRRRLWSVFTVYL